jgi:CRP/FNR family cyclic AMP-dependent transcriptional regulator
MVIEDCKLCIISRAAFDSILCSHAGIALALLKGMAQRHIALTSSVKSLALMDVYGRTAHLLLELAKEENGQKITEKLTHQDIANRVGSSREMISRILKDYRIGGHIQIERKKLSYKRRYRSNGNNRLVLCRYKIKLLYNFVECFTTRN